ncbi:MAG: hypothetical protein FJZ00_08505 [Candidatus Sericytochromatia bacterium]|uniref:Uncharacterized protein n=1 Tax=Candidatus Tanganyikabacteria bacterium TaxID=2961651 RepID=A0A937X5J5_9BACT|nr:hypothetical protein [Candidatus Tanganyikabacteria bacterium]
MRIDVFGREGYRRTFYPFWRDAEVFHDFLTICADIAEDAEGAKDVELPEVDCKSETGESPKILDDEVDTGDESGTLTLEPEFGPAGEGEPRTRRPSGLTRLITWLVMALRRSPSRGGKRVIRSQTGKADRSRTGPGGGQSGLPTGQESPEADSHAIQTTARRGTPAPGQYTLMRFHNLPAVFDHVLLSGHRVALKVHGDGPDLWAVIWRRADGGLNLRWGGLEHPAGPIHRESPQTLYQKLSGYDLDIERVWSQARPPGV